jgi:hypothetical protein
VLRTLSTMPILRSKQKTYSDAMLRIYHKTHRYISTTRARLSPMPLIVILIILLLLFGGGGYYMGPGIGYYGGGSISLILALVVIYLLFGRGRSRL